MSSKETSAGVPLRSALERCEPRWEDGFYDETLGICPQGHQRVMDD
jgi:hypothetical protein